MSPLPRPRQASCAEHAVLSQRIAKAINNLTAAKTEHARAIKEERDIRPYAAALREAKKRTIFWLTPSIHTGTSMDAEIRGRYRTPAPLPRTPAFSEG